MLSLPLPQAWDWGLGIWNFVVRGLGFGHWGSVSGLVAHVRESTLALPLRQAWSYGLQMRNFMIQGLGFRFSIQELLCRNVKRFRGRLVDLCISQL